MDTESRVAKAALEERIPTSADAYAELLKNLDKSRTLHRLLATDARIAQTPKEQIWTLNKAKLYRYIPVAPEEKRHRIPLLLVFAIMNKPHVLDLRPGHSFVEYMLQRGYDTYLLDWGVPGPEDRNLCFDDYTLDYLPRVIRKVKAASGCQEFSMLGWCLGALISTLYAALRSDQGLKNLILLTAPLDFSNKKCGGFAMWTGTEAFNADRVVDAFGNVPGELIDLGAKTLKPVENFVGTYMHVWERMDNSKVVEAWHSMNTWVRDVIPMTGAAFRQLINDFYKEDRLMAGTLRIRGELVDPGKINASVLNVIAESDHITPPCQSEGIMDRLGSKDKEVFRVHGGHIGIMAGSGAEKSTWPHIEHWLAARAD